MSLRRNNSGTRINQSKSQDLHNLSNEIYDLEFQPIGTQTYNK
jgi:hypothetical protein